MKTAFRALVLSAACAALPAAACAAGVTVENSFARPSLGAARNSAAYMTLKNTSGQPDRLIRAEGDVAAEVSLHTHLMKKMDGRVIMQMRPVKDMPIPAHGATKLQPGGLHIMLIGVKKALKPGDSFPLKLIFAHAAPVTVTVPVKPLSATMGMHKMKMDGKMMMKGKMAPSD